MLSLHLYCPTKVYFQRGILKNQAVDLLNDYKKIVIVTTVGFDSKFPYVKNLLDQLNSVEAHLVNHISPNPRLEEITSLDRDFFKDYDAVVGIGGGSALDAAKAFTVYISSDINLETYFINETPINFSLKPLIKN